MLLCAKKDVDARDKRGHDGEPGISAMHDIKWIRENPEAFERALIRRSAELKGTAQRLSELDERRRAAIQKAEAALARRNAASRQSGPAKNSNEEETAQKLLAEVAQLTEDLPKLEP